MSTLKVEEKIILAAPVELVWRFLLDPAAVAGCLPGARLDSVEDERSFTGTMKVKVGPVTTEFKGKATFSEVVPEEHRVRLLASGDDKGGSGSAKMVMSSRIIPSESGGSELHVTADVEMAGKLVRFGRGMMEGIGKQMFKQFSERVHKHLIEMEVAAVETSRAAVAPAPESPPAGADVPTPAAPTAEALASTPSASEPSASAPVAAAGGPDAPAASAGPATPSIAAPHPTPPAPAPAPPAAPIIRKEPEDDVLDAGGLVWSAIWAWIVGFFRRLFGRGG